MVKGIWSLYKERYLSSFVMLYLQVFFKILSWFSEDVKKENIKFIRKQNSFVVVTSNIERQRKMSLERKVACKKRQEDAWSETRLGLGGAGERG